MPFLLHPSARQNVFSMMIAVAICQHWSADIRSTRANKRARGTGRTSRAELAAASASIPDGNSGYWKDGGHQRDRQVGRAKTMLLLGNAAVAIDGQVRGNGVIPCLLFGRREVVRPKSCMLFLLCSMWPPQPAATTSTTPPPYTLVTRHALVTTAETLSS